MFTNHTGISTCARESNKSCAAVQPGPGRRVHHPRCVLSWVHTRGWSKTSTYIRLSHYETLSHCSTFKVAQQTALRAAFLVDQAIQEKQVCVSFLVYHVAFLTTPFPDSQSSLRHRVKLKVRNWLERPCAPTKVSLSSVGWKLPVISPIFWRHLEIGSCLIPRACFWTVRVHVEYWHNLVLIIFARSAIESHVRWCKRNPQGGKEVM